MMNAIRVTILMLLFVVASPVTGQVELADPIRLMPSDSEPSLEVADDLALDLLLREPVVANPLYLNFDERGRLWIVQYRQYPWPAGLKMLSRDSVWRNVYQPPFAPPPPHPEGSPFRGLDRITIHEDTNQDGTFDDHRVFLDGLNFATAALPGRGGVFVLNPPYLLFYADQDRNDRPDSETPRILLSGFGIEDSHSIANSLRWGPDGWIYATQGSTVSGSVITHNSDGSRPENGQVVHSLGQNVWRYHPERHQYEIFAEGGGNAFGVEIDQEAHIYSGHNGGDTRGFHYVQGGYWQKNFGKHGQLSNPYAFDFHGPMRHHAVVRFTHTFSIYQASTFPERYHGCLFGVNPVEHHVVVSKIEPDGSSRKTTDLGLVVQAGKGERARWFTPVDIQLGPDGCLYLADWYSVQPNHYRNHEGQTNPDLGRIYRLRPKTYQAAPKFDLATIPSSELVEHYLFHPNRWYRDQSRRVLADRRDASIVPRLWQLVESSDEQRALDAFWALHVSGGLDSEKLKTCLHHQGPLVRRAAVHLLGDFPHEIAALHDDLLQMARNEPNVEVRCQLAATAKGLPAADGVPMAFSLLQHSEDASDIYLPKAVWWAIEAHADEPSWILTALESSAAWSADFRAGGMRVPQNLMRRYAMAGRQSDLLICARLLKLAPDENQRERLVEAFVAAHAGRPLPALPSELARELARARGPFAKLLAVRSGDPTAINEALGDVLDPTIAIEQRIALVQTLGDIQAAPDRTVVTLSQILRDAHPKTLQSASIVALGRFDQNDVGAMLVERIPHLEPENQTVAVQVLSSRGAWTAALLEAIDQQRLPTSLVDADTALRLRRHTDPELVARLDRLYPQHELTGDEREARIETLMTIVRQGQGSPTRGRELFQGKVGCGKCHRLFTQGGEVGPDLTAYNRSDLRQMLLAIVHPSAEIREGFAAVTAATSDGRILAGLKVEQNEQLLVLRGIDGQDQRIPAEEVEELSTNARSLMPDGLLDTLSDDEIRDLFAFLSSTTPPL